MWVERLPKFWTRQLGCTTRFSMGTHILSQLEGICKNNNCIPIIFSPLFLQPVFGYGPWSKPGCEQFLPHSQFFRWESLLRWLWIAVEQITIRWWTHLYIPTISESGKSFNIALLLNQFSTMTLNYYISMVSCYFQLLFYTCYSSEDQSGQGNVTIVTE